MRYGIGPGAFWPLRYWPLGSATVLIPVAILRLHASPGGVVLCLGSVQGITVEMGHTEVEI